VNGTPGTVGAGTIGTGSTMSPADISLAQQIRAQLLMGNSTAGHAGSALNPQSLSGVQMSANSGVVTLRGTVNSPAERQLLENRIRTMNGVHTVVNGLTVNGTGTAGAGTTTGTGTGTSTGTTR